MTKTLGPESHAAEFLKHFSCLKDPRRTTKGNLQHLLSDIIILTVSAIMSGADNWELARTEKYIQEMDGISFRTQLI